MAKISVFGAGTWGLAIAILLDQNGHDVTVWSAREADLAPLLAHREHAKLPGVPIRESITLTGDLEQAATAGTDLMVLAVASIYTRSIARRLKPYVRQDQVVVNVSKGIEEGTLCTLAEQIREERPQADVAVLSGPSHAEEVSRNMPTACVVGALSKKTAEYVQNLFMSPVFRVYTSPDILGIELGGSLKNVIALAAGMADGLGYGDNTKAALITRGMAEIARLGIAMGARAETLYGLSGIGDLIVTCASVHSRNRRAGVLIGQGATMQEAMDQVQMVVEGVYSAKAGRALAEKYQITMPIIEQVNQVLFEDKPAAQAVGQLMTRDRTQEHFSLPWD